MDKNQTVGFILMALVFMGYMYINRPSEEDYKTYQAKQDSIAQTKIKDQASDAPSLSDTGIKKADLTETDSLNLDSPSVTLAPPNLGPFASSLSNTEKEHSLENSKIKITFSSLGAKPISAVLKEHKTYDKTPLDLIHKDSSIYNFSFYATQNASEPLQTKTLNFKLQDQASNVLRYALEGASGERFIIEYHLDENTHELQCKISAQNMGDILRTNAGMFGFTFGMHGLSHEKSLENERYASTLYYKYLNDKPDYISERSYEKENLIAPLKWISLKQQFFSIALIAETAFDHNSGWFETIEPNASDSTLNVGMYTHSSIPFLKSSAHETFNFSLYLGPNHYQTLKAYDLGLEKQIDLGWGIFGWVNKWLVIPTFNFLNKYISNYGIIILLLTLFIKSILIFVTYKTYLSSAKMKVIKPEIDALNKKYEGKDPLEKQQAQMALYRKTGVSPLAGCVPALVQMPILFAMFKFFPSLIELRQKSFLWAEDLSTYDSIFDLPFDIPFYGAHVSLFTLLMAISIFFYSRYNASANMASGPQAQQMKLMMNIMPVMMLFFFNGYAAALSFYYFLSNVISLIQQFFIKKFFIDEQKIRAQVEENMKKNKTKKKSNFQKRMEELAKQKGYKK